MAPVPIIPTRNAFSLNALVYRTGGRQRFTSIRTDNTPAGAVYTDMGNQIEKGAPLRMGINFRLHYGWDFGTSSGAPLGLEAPDRAALLDADFAILAAAGCRIIRWFVFCDGRNGIRFTGERPAGLDSCIAPALRVALDTAARHGISILFVLLDHTLSFSPEGIPGTSMVKQGHGRLLRHPDLFEALVGNVFAPFWDLVGNHPNVLGYELVNEPEMIMQRREHWYAEPSGVGCPSVPDEHQLNFAEMADRLERTREAVHRSTNAQFSIGSMTARWMGRWANALDPDRDFLTFHYYGDEYDFVRVLEERVAPYTDQLPVGIGEFYPQGARVVPSGHGGWPDISAADFLRHAASFHLQLAMPWVWRPGPRDPGEVPLAECRAALRELEHNVRHERSALVHAS